MSQKPSPKVVVTNKRDRKREFDELLDRSPDQVDEGGAAESDRKENAYLQRYENTTDLHKWLIPTIFIFIILYAVCVIVTIMLCASGLWSLGATPMAALIGSIAAIVWLGRIVLDKIISKT